MVAVSSPAVTAAPSRSARPGSPEKGTRPPETRAAVSKLMSAPITCNPLPAIWTAIGRPIRPRPTTVTRLVMRSPGQIRPARGRRRRRASARAAMSIEEEAASEADWTAAATSIVSVPCRMVTMSADFPRMASRKFSSSTVSACTCRWQSGSDRLRTRRNGCVPGRRRAGADPLRWNHSSVPSVLAIRQPRSPVTMTTRSFIADTQFTR